MDWKGQNKVVRTLGSVTRDGGLCSTGLVAKDKLYVARSCLPRAGNGCFEAVDLGKTSWMGSTGARSCPRKEASAALKCPALGRD